LLSALYIVKSPIVVNFIDREVILSIITNNGD